MEIGLWGFIGILVMSPVLVVAGLYILFLILVIAIFIALIFELIFKGVKWTGNHSLAWYREVIKR